VPGSAGGACACTGHLILLDLMAIVTGRDTVTILERGSSPLKGLYHTSTAKVETEICVQQPLFPGVPVSCIHSFIHSSVTLPPSVGPWPLLPFRKLL
jgi:hypothetical protein